MAYRVLYYATSNSRCTHEGLLRDEGSSMDQSIFKAVLIPYLVNFVLDEEANATYRKRILNSLLANANALWNNLKLDKYPKTFCNYYWGSPIDDSKVPSMGAMVSGASLMENVARMALALKYESDGIHSPALTSERIGEVGIIYDLSGRILNHQSSSITNNQSSIQKGIHIIRNNDGSTKKVLVK